MDNAKKPSGCSLLIIYSTVFRCRSKFPPASNLANAEKPPPRITSLHGNNGMPRELNKTTVDHQHAKKSTALLRSSAASNAVVYANLGNIRAKKSCLSSFNGGKKRSLGAEELKELGNEEYRKGRFAEAVVLYDRAIVGDGGKAAYRSNKAAALIGLGRLFEAVGECKEAVRIDPGYLRAHHRLGNLYLRLGDADRAIHHYKLSRDEADSTAFSRARAVHLHLAKSNEARKLRDWQTILSEARLAVGAGADSAPQVYALQAEAFLKLNKHEQADSIMTGALKLDIDACAKLYGATSYAYVLSVRAQVDLAAGRFEDAVSLAQRAAKLNPTDRDAGIVAQRTQAVASARKRGNELFKANKFGEACAAYGEGLEHDPCNAILLCNRAACRSKLNQWEKATEDCNMALQLRPSYSKARLRRADCSAKLERWEAAIQDYQVLVQEIPGFEEVAKALVQAQAQLLKTKQDEYAKGQRLSLVDK